MSNTQYLDISERKVLLRIVDVLLYISSLWFATQFLNFDYLNFTNSSVYIWMLTLVFYTLLFGEIFLMYDLDTANNAFKVIRSIILTCLFTSLFYFFTPYVTPSLPEFRIQIIYFFLIISIPIVIWRILYMNLLYVPKYFKNLIILGESKKINNILNLVKSNRYHNINFYVSDKKIDGYDQFLDVNTIDLLTLIEESKIPEIIITTSNLSKDVTKNINKQIINLYEKGIEIKSCDDFYEELTGRIPESYLDYNFYKRINYSKNNDNSLYLFFIRFIDYVISILGLIILIPLIPLIFIGNILGNRGKLFYLQERVGKKGKVFKIVKLRSMIKNAEENGAVWATKNDVRITAFGKFLRNTRLDEFPQFINILKGEMSLIGSRPERPEFVHKLEKDIPFYAIRNSIRPGLTGWAQVNYPYANTLEEQKTKLRYDLYYIKERNLFMDFKIIIKTITTILFFKGQ